MKYSVYYYHNEWWIWDDVEGFEAACDYADQKARETGEESEVWSNGKGLLYRRG